MQKAFFTIFFNKIKFFNFKFLSKLFHNLTLLISDFFCTAVLYTGRSEKLDELGFLVLREYIFSNLMNSSQNKKVVFLLHS